MVYLPHYEERIEAEVGDEDNDIYPSSYPTLLPVAATSAAAAAAAGGPSTSTYHLDLEASSAAAAAGMEEKGEGDSEAAAFPATLDLCSAGSLRVVAEQEEALRALYDRYSCGGRQGKQQQQQQQQEQEEGIGGMRFEDLQALLVEVEVVPRLTSIVHLYRLFSAVAARDYHRGYLEDTLLFKRSSCRGSSGSGGGRKGRKGDKLRMEAQPPGADALSFEQFVELLLRLSDQIFADACPRGERLLSFLSWLHLDGVQQQKQQQQQKRHRQQKPKGRSVSSAFSPFSAAPAAPPVAAAAYIV